MGRTLRRGQVWLAQVGRERRSVLVVTRDEVIDVRAMVTVAQSALTTRVGAIPTHTRDQVCTAVAEALGC